MRLVSVNVGMPREVEWQGGTVMTGIFKEPVDGPQHVHTLNVEGDRQADLSVHGGPEKAVYVYASEHYQRWREERPDLDFHWAKFGENLTTEGILDSDVNVGDRFRIGTAEFRVTQPRLPCFKLGVRMGDKRFVADFLHRGLLGFYLAVTREGVIEAGDEIVQLERDPNDFRVTEIARLYRDRSDTEGRRHAASVEVLPEDWRNWFADQVA